MTDPSDPSEGLEDDYKVGYGRPPREHMQKAGAPSKNPYGRKGKPENRAAIAARKAPKTVAEALLGAARRKYPVKGPGDRVTRRLGSDLLGEAVVKDALKNLQRALKASMSLHHPETARPIQAEPAVPTGVMVISQPAATLEETMRMMDARVEELNALHAAGRRWRPAEAAPEPRRDPPPQPVQTRAEERVYGRDPAAAPHAADRPLESSPGLLDPITQRRSLKADGTYL